MIAKEQTVDRRCHDVVGKERDSTSQVEKRRQRGPDLLKGLLMVLVVYGHTFSDGQNDNPVKYAVYALHMPVFLALSGYLLNVDRLQRTGLPRFFGKYWRRMLWQWCAATLLFTAVREAWPEGVRSAVESWVLRPWFHLWYIPVLFALCLGSLVVVRLGLRVRVIIGAGLLAFALISCQIYGWVPALAKDSAPLGTFIAAFDYRYFAYPLYFVLGVAVRTYPRLRVRGVYVWPLVVVLLAFYLSFYWTQPLFIVRNLVFVVMNCLLIVTLPSLLALLEPRLERIGRFLIPCGVESLWLYLLHPLVMMPLWQLDLTSWQQALVGVPVTIVVCSVPMLCLRTKATLRERRGRANSMLP